MATAGSIVVDLLMKTGSFETDSKRAERRMKQLEREINKTAKAVALFGVTAAAGFAAAIKSASSYMAEMGDAAQRTSIGVQAFSELAYAAEQSSLSQGELERVLRRSTEAINHGAAGTGKQAKALDALGISAYDAEGGLKTADAMLRDMIGKFSKLEPGARKTGLVLDLFGQQLGQKVIPMLNLGTDELDKMTQRAHELGVVVDDEAAAAAAQFESDLSDLKRMSQGVAIAFATDLLPEINKVASGFLEAARASNGFFASLATFESVATKAWEEFWEVDDKGPMRLFNEQERLLSKIAEHKALIEGGEVSGLSKWTMQKGLKQAEARLAIIQQEISGLEQSDNWDKPEPTTLPGVTITPDLTPDKPSRGGGSRASKQIDEGERLIKQMNERIALIGKETEYEQLLAKIGVDSITFRSDAQKELALNLAANLDELTKEIEHERTLKELREQQSITQAQFMRDLEAFGQGNSVRQLNSELERVEDRYRAIIDARRNSPLGLSEDELAQIKESLDLELEMVQQHHEDMKALRGEWTLGASEALNNYVDNARDVAGQVEDIFANAFSGIEDTVFDFVKTGQMDLRGLLGSITDDVLRMLIRMGTQMTANAILGKTLGATSTAASIAMGTATATAWAPAAAFASLASFGGNSMPAMAGISSTVGLAQGLALTGMAHDGIDVVPKTGTWLLEKGERVMTSDTSARLDAVLNRIENRDIAPPVLGKAKQRSSGGVTVNLIESRERAGEVKSRTNDSGEENLDVFVADIRGMGGRAEVLEETYGLRRVGR